MLPLLLLVQGAFGALQVLSPEPQASYTFQLPAAQNASNDLSLDEAPLVRGGELARDCASGLCSASSCWNRPKGSSGGVCGMAAWLQACQRPRRRSRWRATFKLCQPRPTAAGPERERV